MESEPRTKRATSINLGISYDDGGIIGYLMTK